MVWVKIKISVRMNLTKFVFISLCFLVYDNKI